MYDSPELEAMLLHLQCRAQLKPLLKDRKYQFVLSTVLHPRMHRVNAHMLRAQTE